MHWGDADAGGFRIAEYIAKAAALHGRRLDLYGMDGQLCDADRVSTVARRSLDDTEVDAICRTCTQRGWVAEGNWIRTVRLAVEQEAMRHRPLATPILVGQ